MAVIQNIPESKQTPSAQKSMMKYCMRPDKTNLNEKVQLVSGHNCVPELAHKSFLATQALYKAEQEKHIADDKDNILFYQYVQSFSPKDKLTPEQAHEIGMQFVRECFPKHEVLVATHLDNNQLHNHFVINATSFKDGSKLHMNKYTLADMRRLNDEICLAHGLSVLKPYDPTKPSMNLGQREYRAQEKGESWKFDLLYVITDLMKTCGSKDEFINKLKDKGYDVRWQEHQKTMTYTCPNGMKVRDNKLHDTRFLKEAMEREFRIREQCLEQLARLAEREGQGNIRETISTDGLRYPEGAVGADAVAAEEFNERLFTAMKRLPSARAIENFMNETLYEQSRQFKVQTDEVKESVRQAGSSQEKFISEASSLRREQSKELSSMLNKIMTLLKWFTIAAVSASILLSGLVSVLCWHWLK